MSVPIAILASGRGSNFDAIAEAISKGKLDAEVVAVLSDKKEALVLEKARKLGLPALHVPAPSSQEEPDPGKRRIIHDQRVLDALSKYSPRFLVMAGYMRVVTPALLEAFRDTRQGRYTRITNIHPSLLPAFPGVAGYAQAYRYGAKLAGVTVHLVEQEVDSGPICAQEAFSIGDCSSEEEVERKGLAIEHRLYPETLSWILPERFDIEMKEGRTQIRVRSR